MLQSIASSLDGSALNSMIADAYWLWPVLEISHFIGLSLLLGGLIIVDLRLAGLFLKLDPVTTHSLIPLVVLGFFINMVSGLLFFAGDPMRYVINIGFQIKMVLVMIAGVNAIAYYWLVHPTLADWRYSGSSPPRARVVGLISLTAWTGVLLFGRLIPYVGTG